MNFPNNINGEVIDNLEAHRNAADYRCYMILVRLMHNYQSTIHKACRANHDLATLLEVEAALKEREGANDALVKYILKCAKQ